MHSQEEIKSLYETELKPQLEGMEKMRKFIKRWKRLAIASAVVAFLFLSNCSSAVEIIGGIVFIAGAIFSGGKAYITYNKYTIHIILLTILKYFVPFSGQKTICNISMVQ